MTHARQRDEEPLGSEGGRGGRPRDPALDEVIISATRRRLVLDGYSRMTIGDIAADAGVSRPTLYRRWPNKLQLTIDALDWGFRTQSATYPTPQLDDLPARDAFTEAVRRVDPRYYNPDAMVLMGNFMAERLRTPELLDVVRTHAVEPRVGLVEDTLTALQHRGQLRDNLDTRTVATMCFGTYYAAFLRGDDDHDRLAEKVVDTLWPALTA